MREIAKTRIRGIWLSQTGIPVLLEYLPVKEIAISAYAPDEEEMLSTILQSAEAHNVKISYIGREAEALLGDISIRMLTPLSEGDANDQCVISLVSIGDYDMLVTGDAYVDHPTFGAAVIGRVLEAEGYRVAVLAQPDWHSAEAFAAMGKPKLGVLIGAGNLDSMVAHYTAAKRRRSEDFYSPGKRAGLRPDRAVIVYANRAREAFPDCPIVIGGLEASLRRFAHYDYWDDAVRRSVLVDSGADLLVYGMGETATREIAAALKKKRPVGEITEVRGTAYLTKTPPEGLALPSFETVRDDKRAYARAAMTEAAEHDAVRGRTLLQSHGDRPLVVNPPAAPLDGAALDAVAELPYTRT